MASKPQNTPDATQIENMDQAPAKAVAILSSSTIVGLHWQSVAPGTSGYAASAPIEGKLELEGVLIAPQGIPADADPHRFQLAVASDLPSTQAEIDAADQLFPRASQAIATRYCLIIPWGSAGLFLPVGSVLAPAGRRIVGRWYNGATSTADAYISLVVHGLSGGEHTTHAAFLSGEPVEER